MKPKTLILACLTVSVAATSLAPLGAPQAGGAIPLLFRCDGNNPLPWNSMESGSMFLPFDRDGPQPSCWGHLGHMTFFVEASSTSLVQPDTLYSFEGASGWVLASETYLGGGNTDYCAGGVHVPDLLPCSPVLLGVAGPAMPVEVSADGVRWTRVGYVAQPPLAPNNNNLQSICVPLEGPLAQCFISFNLPGNGASFRFFRVSKSVTATESLAAYINAARITVSAKPAQALGSPPLQAGSRPFACDTDVFEDYVSLHPCHFGVTLGAGLVPLYTAAGNAVPHAYYRHHYDAASLMHTYFIDHAKVDAISGSVKAIPWRPGDEGCNVVLPCALQSQMIVELSNDGVNYTEAHRFPIPWDRDTSFETPDLGGRDARFVRLHVVRHPCFDRDLENGANACYHAAKRHFEGLMLDSRFVVTGDLVPR